MAMSILQRARDSGRCPPSLLMDNYFDLDGFNNDASRLLNATGFGLSNDMAVVDVFEVALQKATNINMVQDPVQKASILEKRRCLLLAIAGSTPPSSKTLERIVAKGYLATVKVWLDDALAGRVGGMDLLLHILTNVVGLPVTKAVVKSSGMGKAIGAIEKHSLCKGTPNEAVILQRVANIKDAWQASVKARKAQEAKDSPKIAKREAAAPTSPNVAKRVKVEPTSAETKKSKTFASLVKKAANLGGSKPAPPAPPRIGVTKSVPSKQSVSASDAAALKKRSNKFVKWADDFGGDLVASRVIEGDSTSTTNEANAPAGQASWTSKKKRDRAREKELLASVKKVKLLDEDDEPTSRQTTTPTPSMKTTIQWTTPSTLPDSGVSKPSLNSTEVDVQNERSKVVAPANYFSENEVPPNPTPLSDVEQALDMTSQSSAVVASIPFFVPQQPEPAPAPELAATPAVPAADIFGTDNSSLLAATQQTPAVAAVGATPELLQALGLPMFLVGQDVQAVQTLASSPGLLNTMVDAHGMYDQTRLLSLVQTLSGTPQESGYNAEGSSGFGAYGSSSSLSQSPTHSGMSSGARASKSDEGNLHLAGYGPGTTQADIITMFLPYVKVDEVVLKGTFAFVNTSDPVSAQRAKDALQGTLLNGMPVRINAAQRKAREAAAAAAAFGQTSSAYGPSGTMSTSSFAASGISTSLGGGSAVPPAPAPPSQQPPPPPPQHPPSAEENVDHVRDDRGNTATKNLFVAGYGAGTSEQQLRDVFNQHANVIGVVLKGNFSFVNTSTRQEAVRARQMLQGQSINGGTLRINFAKETGRLGTSFDITYNERSGPNARRGSGGNTNASSYYGRGF